MIFRCFAGIHMVLVSGFRGGIGVCDLERTGGFAGVGEGEIDIASDGVITDRSLWTGLWLDAIVVLFIVRSGIHGDSTELAEEAVGAVQGDVVIRLRSWLLGVNLGTVIGEEPIVGEVLASRDGVPAGR